MHWHASKKAQTAVKASGYAKGTFDNDCNIFKTMNIESAKKNLMAIPEFGEKAVACLLELGLEKPSMVINVNMLRVTSRSFNFKWAKIQIYQTRNN